MAGDFYFTSSRQFWRIPGDSLDDSSTYVKVGDRPSNVPFVARFAYNSEDSKVYYTTQVRNVPQLWEINFEDLSQSCLLYTSPSPRDS